MIVPSIALPTGPYDWHPEIVSREEFARRTAIMRAAMSERGTTHAVVHGNGFDNGALAWLTHFTPKLGPAYALVPARGQLRLLFAGGPGMKPSAQRLTWIDDVVAIRNLEGDIGRWLAETSTEVPVRLGLVEGAAMLRGDWLALQKVAGGATVEIDDVLDAQPARNGADEIVHIARSAGILKAAADAAFKAGQAGTRMRALCLQVERAAYAGGAQDVRVRLARRPWEAPLRLPEDDASLAGPTPIALALRHAGYWVFGRFVLGDVSPALRATARGALAACLSRENADDVPIKRMVSTFGSDISVGGHGVGLSLRALSDVGEVTRDTLIRAGGALSIAVDVPIHDSRHTSASAVWSVLIGMEKGSPRLLWSPPDLDFKM